MSFVSNGVVSVGIVGGAGSCRRIKANPMREEEFGARLAACRR